MLWKGKQRGTWSGYFGPDDAGALVELLAPVADDPRRSLPRGNHPRVGEANIYFSLQAVRPELAEGRRGRLTRARATTRDRDVLATNLFVVDVDPERDPKDSSATDAEKACAAEVTEAVRGWLRERGVEAIRADSGNGYHLLVPVAPAVGVDVRRAAKDARDLLRLLD